MITTHPLIDEILDEYQTDLKNHDKKLRHHIYRVYALTQVIDNDESNQEKYAIAGAFHDLGIWTNNTFDYLDPSIALAKEYLKAKGREDWIDEISLMIDMHHKISKYDGDYFTTVETFRRADWIDVVLGVMKFGVSRPEITEIQKAYSGSGFHRFIVGQSFKRFFRFPLNPLPMFKK